MIEDHVVPFLQQWKVGLGMLGEQGAEGIHARFNQLERTYCNMANGVERLRAMVADHFRQVCPENVALEPPCHETTEEREIILLKHSDPYMQYYLCLHHKSKGIFLPPVVWCYSCGAEIWRIPL